MFANLIELFSGKNPPHHYETGFVEGVKIVRKKTPNPRLERLLWIGWGVIAVKTLVVFWAVHYYKIPFNALWVVLPTIAFAALVTWVYLRRD